MRWLKRIGAALAAIIAAAASFISIAKDAGWETSGIWAWLADNAFWIVPITLLLLGLYIGWAAHESAVSVETSRAAAIEEAKQNGETERLKMTYEREDSLKAEEIKRQKREEELASICRFENERRVAQAMEVRHKAILKAASEHNIYCSNSSLDFKLDRRFVDEFFDLETIDAFKNRMHLNDKAKRWLKDYHDTFEVINDSEVMEHAVFDKTEQKNPGSDRETAGMGWWWYSHEDEPTPEKLRELRRNTAIHGHFDSEQWL